MAHPVYVVIKEFHLVKVKLLSLEGILSRFSLI